MFGLGDDFDIDESFLDEVFEVEKASIKNASNQQRSAVARDLDRTHPNILKESSFNSDLAAGINSSSPCISNEFSNKQVFGNVLSSHRTVVTRNQLPTSVLTKESSSRKVRARKFPGPAGLLPERQGNTSLVATEDFLNELEEELKEDKNYKEEVLSQDSARSLESPAWIELIRDLGPDGKALLNRLNIASVSARAKQTRALKVPFLALVIKNVDTSSTDPCLYLSDSTGEMVGAVHREVWEQLGEDLIIGAVIVLINVGVLCAGHTSSRHYLNITTNNIASLYSPTQGSDIRVTNMKPLLEPDCSKFLQTWQELLSTPVRQAAQTPDDGRRELFSTVSFSPSGSTPRRDSVSSRNGPLLNRSFDFPIATESPLRYRDNFPSHNLSSVNRPLNCNVATSKVPVNPRGSQLNINPCHTSFPNRMSDSRAAFQNGPISNAVRASNSFIPHPPKRPRIHSPNRPTVNLNVSSQASQSVVESLLDGIDTDSLFGDF